MSVDLNGTNTEKTDELIVAMVELRTTVRFFLAVIAIALPMIVGLLTFLTVQSFKTDAKVDHLSDQMTTVRGDVARLNDQMTTVRGDVARLAERQERPDRAAKP